MCMISLRSGEEKITIQYSARIDRMQLAMLTKKSAVHLPKFSNYVWTGQTRFLLMWPDKVVLTEA